MNGTPHGRERMHALGVAAIMIAALPSFLPAQREVRGPILWFRPAQVSFDTAYCGTRKELGWILSNEGDAPTRATIVAPPSNPFSTNFPSVLNLLPRDTISVSAFFAPDRTGPAADSLTLAGDSRRPISLCLLMDVSMSMNQMDVRDSISGTDVTRLRAAREICLSAIDGLVEILSYGIIDQAAVARFADAGDYALLQDFTWEKPLLRAAVPDSATGLNTCLYDALIRAAAQLAPREGKKYLLLVTDGQNTCNEPPSAQDVIDAARRANVTVYPVGIGNPDSVALKNIASATGGEYFSIYSLADAPRPFRAIVGAASAANRLAIQFEGTGVAPRIRASAPFIDFDTLRNGGESCRAFTLYNEGTAPFSGRLSLSNDPLHGISSSLGSGGIVSLRPGDSLVIRLCYRPFAARGDTGSAIIASRLPECESNRIAIPYRGASTAPLSLALPADLRGRPGGTIVLPIRLSTRIPASAGARAFRFSLRYNRSMLYPLPSYFGGEERAILSEMPSASHATQFEGTEAVTTYSFSGGAVVNDLSDVLLCRPAYLVLMGDALTTAVRVESAGTDNPFFPAGPVSTITFTADSLCDQDRRLINSSALSVTGIAQSSPNPVASGAAVGATIRYSIAAQTHVRLLLVDALGRAVRTLVNEVKPAGEYSCAVATAGLPPGTYMYLFEAGSTREIRKMLVRP